MREKWVYMTAFPSISMVALRNQYVSDLALEHLSLIRGKTGSEPGENVCPILGKCLSEVVAIVLFLESPDGGPV